MYCSKCGVQLTDDARFCFRCGNNVKAFDGEGGSAGGGEGPDAPQNLYGQQPYRQSSQPPYKSYGQQRQGYSAHVPQAGFESWENDAALEAPIIHIMKSVASSPIMLTAIIVATLSIFLAMIGIPYDISALEQLLNFY